MTPLRQRMIEEMQIRNYSPTTQRAYVYCIARFAQFHGKSPTQLGPTDIRAYLAHLANRATRSWCYYNQTLTALRFLYQHTLNRDWVVRQIPRPKPIKTLPVVLSQAEIARLFASTPNLKHRAILMTVYSAGLRVSEV